MKFLFKQEYSLNIKGYCTLSNKWLPNFDAFLFVKNKEAEIYSSYTVPISIKHTLPTEVMTHYGASFVDEILYFKWGSYYVPISLAALNVLESQDIIEELDDSISNNSCMNSLNDSLCDNSCKEEDDTKQISSRYNTTCSVCGSPAYQGLGAIECSNGCN